MIKFDLCDFGDILADSNEDKYIYLTASLEYVYVARILTSTETNATLTMKENFLKRSAPIEDQPLFWLIRLTCEDFKGQAALLTNPQKGIEYQKHFKKIASNILTEEDLLALKKEILRIRTFPELKQLITDTEI